MNNKIGLYATNASSYTGSPRLYERAIPSLNTRLFHRQAPRVIFAEPKEAITSLNAWRYPPPERFSSKQGGERPPHASDKQQPTILMACIRCRGQGNNNPW